MISDSTLALDISSMLPRTKFEGLRAIFSYSSRNYAEPLPRAVGKSFTHNKEVFFRTQN